MRLFGGLSASTTQRLQCGNPSGLLASHCMPQIPILLKAKPRVRRHSQHSSESQGGIRCDSTLAADDLVEPWEGNPQTDSKLGLADTKGDKEFMQQHFAKVIRRQDPGQAAGDELSAHWPGVAPNGSP